MRDNVGSGLHVTPSPSLDLLHFVRVSEIVEESDFRSPMLQLVLEGPETEVGIGVIDEETFQVLVQLGGPYLVIENLRKSDFFFVKKIIINFLLYLSTQLHHLKRKGKLTEL